MSKAQEWTGSELRAVPEFFIARLDFFAGQRAEAIHSEAFATEAAHHAAVDHCVAQLGEIDIALFKRDAAPRQIADESAREAITSAGRVEHLAQQIARCHEVTAAPEENGAKLAALDDQRVRTHVEDDLRGLPQVALAGEQ